MTKDQANSAHKIESVISEERQRIAAHRHNKGIKDDKALVGLSLSGGGIRSASFAMGVVQALHKKGKLDNIDYLSTVSGGGYLGTSLTWFSYVKANAKEPINWHFPFGEIGKGARSKDSNNPLNFIRQHGNYLLPNRALGILSVAANFIRNSLLSGAVYLLLFTFLFFVLEDASLYQAGPFSDLIKAFHINILILAGLAFLALLGVSILIYGLYTFFVDMYSSASYRGRFVMQVWQGWSLTLSLILIIAGSLNLVHGFLDEIMIHAGSMITAIGLFGSYVEIQNSQKIKVIKNNDLSTLRLTIITLLLCYGLLLMSYALAHKFSVEMPEWQVIDGAIYLLAPSLFFGVLVNLNEFGPGRYYRDRLMETFMPNLSTIRDDRWRLAIDANKTKLSSVCGENETGPYQIINTNVILADSNDAKFRGRGGDSFTLSPLFCGGDSIGWYRTSEFHRGRLTVATAMATSGAALNPYAAVNGQGVTRQRLLSLILSFLNVRLGYTVANPKIGGLRGWAAKRLPANFYIPQLYHGIFGHGLDENNAYLTLSDGGHFEDSGIYELARRKLSTIIISEAGADSEYAFGDLANAIERVRVDFGYYIVFDFNADIEALLPSNDTGATHLAFAKRGYAKGKIYYDNGQQGDIIFLKAVLTKNLPIELYSYKQHHPSFPNESTSDQFFSEEQVEAYRELGYQLSIAMLNDKGINF